MGERAKLRAIAGGKGKVRIVQQVQEPLRAINLTEVYTPHYDALITPHYNKRGEHRGTVIELLYEAAYFAHWNEPAFLTYMRSQAMQYCPLIEGKAHVLVFATMRGNDLDTFDPTTGLTPLTKMLGIPNGYHLQLSLKEFSMKIVSAMQTQKDKVCSLHRKIFDNPLSSHIFIQPYKNVESLLRETQIQIAQSACAELELIG